MASRGGGVKYTFIKLEKAAQKEQIYTLIFLGEIVNHDDSIFEAEVFDDAFQRKVIRARTNCDDEWVRGYYCIPKDPNDIQIIGLPKSPNSHLGISINDSDSDDDGNETSKAKRRAQEQKKKNQTEKLRAAFRRGETIAPGGVPVELVLDTLSAKRIDILEGCAKLALLDHNLQNAEVNRVKSSEVKFDGFQLKNLVKVIGVYYQGYTYTLIFHAVSDKYGEAIFEANVWDPVGLRMVKGFRTIRPCGEWTCGTYSIPKCKAH